MDPIHTQLMNIEANHSLSASADIKVTISPIVCLPLAEVERKRLFLNIKAIVEERRYIANTVK